jgi:hypothetical protein
MNKLYYAIPGITKLISANISSSYNSTTTIATIEALDDSLTLGQHLTVDFGYTTDHDQLFQGYVKSKSLKLQSNTYTYTLADDLVRAVDYFIVSDSPDDPLTYRNILAENLIGELLSKASLTSYQHGSTSFTFGVNNEFEINLVNVYDYSRTICDLLTWHIWCDKDGVVQFRNRKNHPMLGGAEASQPGYETDTVSDYVWNDQNVLDSSRSIDDKSLRNKIVVYGNEIHASAQDNSTPYMKWKTAVLSDSQLVDSQDMAQKIADYNLLLLNRLTDTVNATLIGDCSLNLFDVVNINSSKLGLTNEKYLITTCEHRISKDGYTTTLVLNK